MSVTLRRHRRYVARIPVHIRVLSDPDGPAHFETVSGDVSLSGLFLLMLRPHQLTCGAILSMDVVLPEDLSTINLRGRVMRVTPRGVGVQILPGAAMTERWEAFLDTVARHVHDSAPHPSDAVIVEHTFTPRDLDALYDLQEIDLFIGGMYLPMQAPLTPHMMVRVMVVHPIDGSRFRLWGRVTRSFPDGVGVAFVGDARETSEQMRVFIEQGLPRISLDELLIQTPTSLGRMSHDSSLFLSA